MDIATAKWFPRQALDDYKLIHEYHINTIAELTTTNMASTLGDNLQRSFSSESFTSYPNFNTQNTAISSSSIETSQNSTERPTKLHKTGSWNSNITTNDLQSPKSSSHFLSFESPKISQTANSQQFTVVKPKDEAVSPTRNVQFQPLAPPENPNYDQMKVIQGVSSHKRSYASLTRSPHAQDHILAERKRREKLSQRFISLSALIPGLKKMDKATVLADAIKYVKQLQERVHILEEQTKKRTMESFVLVKKSQLSSDDESLSSCCDDNSDGSSDSALPEIEAKVSDKDVLIRIHCEKQQGVVPKILHEIENVHLSIVNSNVLPFGNSTLDITIVAQMDSEHSSMAVKDLVKNLRSAFLKFM